MKSTLEEKLVVAGSAVAYALTAAPHVLGGDNGEFATLAATGGVAHPPGYPLYVLYLRATRWLPSHSPAHAAALATAILGVILVVFVQRAARSWGASPFASALASAAFAFSPLAWSLATHAEAFTLNALLAVAIVALAAPGQRSVRGATLVGALALLAGLGLSNHHSVILVAPIGLFAAIQGVRESTRRTRAVAIGLAALALGLTPYVYLVVAARSANADAMWIWGDTRDLHGLIVHFTRAEYGTTELGLGTYAREPLAQVAALARGLVVSELGLPVLAALGAIIALARTRTLRGRGAAIALFASLLLAGPVFVAWFNMPPRGFGALIIERFYLLPAALVAVMAAPAIDVLLPTMRARVALRRALVGLTAFAAAVLALPNVREHHRDDVERYAHDALRLAEKDAIIVGSGDHRFGAFMYARYALAERRDVVFVNPRLLLGSWYPKQMSRQLGFEIERGHATSDRPDYPILDVPALTRQLIDTGRPLYFTDWFFKGLDTKVPSYPIGPLIRVVADPRRLPSPSALFAMNVAADAAMAPRREGDGAPEERVTWAGDLASDYARPWSVLADAFARAGDAEKARSCSERARARAPWLAAP